MTYSDCYTVILWAYDYGVTDGTSETTFSPGETCQRDMMVTYLYRYVVEPLTTA
ncbi:MAG: hypothetical protein LUF80_00675 [Oscillospiraceae bacterium]|nr:hypothetical protein [Oscillospiraceae bacterium]